MRLRARSLDDRFRKGALVEAALLEVRGHRLLVADTDVRDTHRDRGRVDPARQARADGDVASQLEPDRVEEGLANGRDRIGRRLARLEPPVPLDSQTLRPEDEVVPGREAANAGEERLVRVVEVALLEVVADGGEVRPQPLPPKRPRLAREGEPPALEAVVERLHAEPVARGEQAALPRVPDRERPHPVEALDAALAPLAVGLEDHLRVRLRAEAMALRLELGPQLDVVVDLAVMDQLEPAVPACEGLQARVREVDDREPEVAERDAGCLERAPPVRPAVRELGEHALDGLGLGRPVERNDAAEAAHQAASTRSGSGSGAPTSES